MFFSRTQIQARFSRQPKAFITKFWMQAVPYFNQQALDDLTAGLSELPQQLRRLKNGCAGLALTNERAQEYLQHGLSRRLSTMVQMVQTVFELLPPADEAIPENVTVMAATALDLHVFDLAAVADQRDPDAGGRAAGRELPRQPQRHRRPGDDRDLPA
jgi:hypothetical protein